MPMLGDIEATVEYTAFPGLPLLFASSTVRLTEDRLINALRTDQLIFTRGLQTHGVYIDHNGRKHTVRMYDPNRPEQGFTQVNLRPLPPDLPFIGLYHEARRDGIGIVTIDHHIRNHDGPVSVGGDAAYFYFYDGKAYESPWVYMCRGEVHHIDIDGRPHNLINAKFITTVVPAGTLVATHSAIVVFTVGEGAGDEPRLDEVERWTRLLRTPPRVRVLSGRLVRKRSPR